MVSLTYAAVPLYDLFCRTTGFGGTPVAKKDDVNGVNIESINIPEEEMEKIQNVFEKNSLTLR